MVDERSVTCQVLLFMLPSLFAFARADSLSLMSQGTASMSPLKSPSQHLSSVTLDQKRVTARKILQVSHMELLYEGARPEPRLRRLLGHASAHENAGRWCQENKRKSIFYIRDDKEKAQEETATAGDSHQNGMSLKSPTKVQRFGTLSEFQVAIQSQIQHRQLVIVNATEVDGDSDDSDDSDSSDEICESDSCSGDDDDDDDNDNDTSVCSHNRNADIERVDYLTKALSLKDDGNSSNIIKYRNAKAEQDDDRTLWGQEPRVLNDSESQRAFYNVWL
jgi:hypothetical protein